MKAGLRYPILVRSLAAAAGFAVAAQGGGLPMCASLFAAAAAPCAMHTHVSPPARDPPVATLSATLSGHEACHADAASLACAAGGVCPTGGPVAPVSVTPPAALRPSLRVPPPSLPATFRSYLAPPLSPPPQG